MCLVLLAVAGVASGCEQAADLIPGEEPTPAAPAPAGGVVITPVTPSATPPPAAAPAPDATPALLLLPMELQPAADPDAAAVTAADDQNDVAAAAAAQDDEADPDEFRARLARSVVQVLVTDPQRNPPIVRDGSGVVIDVAHGLILTSAHVVDPFERDGARRYGQIAIAVSPIPGEEPVIAYRAVLAALDPGSELAVLRVVGLLDEFGSPPAAVASDAAEDGSGGSGDTGGALLVLPAAGIGDSGSLPNGESLLILGHPGLHPSGAETPQAVTVTEATLIGARGDSALGDRAWLKTDALLPHGYGGAGVFNSAGELIGIAAQFSYDATVPIVQVRPLEVAAAVLEAARAGGRDATYTPPLSHPGGVPGTSLATPEDGIVVGAPQFATEAIEEDGERNLFDYGRVFSWRTQELQYEFVAQNIPNDAIVQEFWYYYDAFQDHLSSTYRWTKGPFAVVSDRLSSPNRSGIPDGRWTLEVWVDGQLRASGRAYVGVLTPTPSVGGLRFGSTLSRVEPGKAEPPTTGAPQLLAFFDYQGASTAERLSWRVFHNGELAYESPPVPWRGGESGTWWVGLPFEDGLHAGRWTFEILFDDVERASGSISIRR